MEIILKRHAEALLRKQHMHQDPGNYQHDTTGRSTERDQRVTMVMSGRAGSSAKDVFTLNKKRGERPKENNYKKIRA